jgi:hypothetical protein
VGFSRRRLAAGGSTLHPGKAGFTGALAASDAAVDALLEQAGALRAGSIEELFDMAMTFGGQPLGVRQEDVAEAIVAAAATCPSKPVLAVLVGREGQPAPGATGAGVTLPPGEVLPRTGRTAYLPL